MKGPNTNTRRLLIQRAALAAAVAATALHAAEPVRVTVYADQVRFRLHAEVIGANMEDLHYQMVGGFDSQLIHGESFFEPSPTELAQTSGQVDGFTSVRGTWRSLPDGAVRVDAKGSKIEDTGSVPAEAGVAADDKKTGAMPNVSQPWGVYQTDWKAVLWTQGNIYYTQDKVWFQPAYYVQQMIAQAWAEHVVRSEVAAPDRTLDVLAARTADGGALTVRVVPALFLHRADAQMRPPSCLFSAKW